MYSLNLSPDGRSVLYISVPDPLTSFPPLFVIPANGGTPRELTNWQRINDKSASAFSDPLAWTSDSRWLIAASIFPPGAKTSAEWPVDGGDPIATGAGAALRAAGLESATPTAVRGNRVLFSGKKGEQVNVWEIDLTPGSWRVAGAPRQLTFGTEQTLAEPVSAIGTTAVEVSKLSGNFYLLPLDPKTGQASGTARRLTQDGRAKYLYPASGEPGSVYVRTAVATRQDYYALNLETGKQTLVSPGDQLPPAVSSDGRQVAFNVQDGDGCSIRVGAPGAGAATARELCKRCGFAAAFSPDGRFVLNLSNLSFKSGSPGRKMTVRLLEVASGKDRPWLEHPTDSVKPDAFGGNGEWVAIGVKPLGSSTLKYYLVPWREEPVPVSEWIAVPPLGDYGHYAPATNFLYFRRDSKIVGVRFDPKTRSFGQPFDVKFPPGSAAEWKSGGGGWEIAGPGLVFIKGENHSGVWLMKLPE
ncbi:MAG TPA: hypothetical protein VMH81_16770 [Bryobacteraceae bacterium]|nr:hypothetical protein [Bryobacteraceae bacterium]